MIRKSTLKFIVYSTSSTNETLNSNGELRQIHASAKVSDYCVENIMNFARSYRVMKSQATGPVEMMMN